MTDISVTEKLGIGAGTIHARDMTTDEADRETEEVSRFITPIDRNKAVAVCIDGRERASAVHGAVLPLGPHIAGGSRYGACLGRISAVSSDRRASTCLSTRTRLLSWGSLG